MSDTVCILPWIHMYINSDGTVLPCCIGNHTMPLSNVQQKKIVEVWNSEKYKTIRNKMMLGEKPRECSACYSLEEKGIKSFRLDNNKKFEKYLYLIDDTKPDGTLDSMNLKYFDVRWSNICNFKCRSCSSTYSSSWASEDNDNGANKKVFIHAGGIDNNDLYSQFLPYFDQIEEFYFAGGEPLLTDKHYDILDYLISKNKTNVKLRYNTNLSNFKFKDRNVIDIWKNFSNVEVYVSLDSWGDRAEYIREGTVWKDIETNLITLKKELPRLKVRLSTVVSIFNVLTLKDFFNYLKENELFNERDFNLTLYNIQHPSFYSSKILPDEIRDKAVKQLQEIDLSNSINSQVKNVITHLQSETFDRSLIEMFREKTINLDRIRNRNFIKTFPELEQIIRL